jgi:hypothetical protein
MSPSKLSEYAEDKSEEGYDQTTSMAHDTSHLLLPYDSLPNLDKVQSQVNMFNRKYNSIKLSSKHVRDLAKRDAASRQAGDQFK